MSERIDSNWTPVGTLPNHLTLRSSRLKYFFSFFLSLLFVAVAIWAFNGGVNEWWVWVTLILFGSGALLSLIMLFNPSTLHLTRKGFEQTHLFKSKSFEWQDVSEFNVMSVRTGNFSNQSFVTFSRLDDEGNVIADISTKLLGGSASLANTFGMNPKALAILLNKFRDRTLTEGPNAPAPISSSFSGDVNSPDDSWQPVNDGGVLVYTPGDEKAPWVKWGLSTVLLATIATGALWLVSQTIVTDDIPTDRPRVELPTSNGDETEEAETPKSSDEEAWVRALEKDTLGGYREYLQQFPNGKFEEDAQEQIDAYDNKAWETAENRQTIAGYEDYLEAWPEGRHASKARERIAEMKARAEAITKDAKERAAQEAAGWDRAARE
ncbi:MAG: hypothetical protein KJN99_13770, partial [Marinicaulis sp.]|nr:hypothetical protein [Marinicaulis sp.]